MSADFREPGWRLPAVVLAAALLVGAGAFGMYVYMRRASADAAPAGAPPAPSTNPPATGGEAAITLTPDAASRAGIDTGVVRMGRPGRHLSIPGIVQPNAYAQVLVTALAAGQVQSVSAELGALVRAGETLATIHSPELAEAERVYISMRAELTAAHQRLLRLEDLVKIGAASRQELEAAQVEHTTHATDVEGARARLLFLGVTAGGVNALADSTAINPLMTVAAPAAGVITRRAINRGQNVTTSTELFTIVDLSSVWVVGDVYERDLGRVSIGRRATMTSAALPGRTWNGVVTYVDPQIAAGTRTAQLRVETANPGGQLRLGMYLEMVVEDAAAPPLVLLPRAAVQTIGSQSVVYVADPAQNGRFLERSVRVGASTGEDVEVLAGLSEGERVVTAGSFFLRAERDRLGLPPPRPLNAARTP